MLPHVPGEAEKGRNQCLLMEKGKTVREINVIFRILLRPWHEEKNQNKRLTIPINELIESFLITIFSFFSPFYKHFPCVT